MGEQDNKKAAVKLTKMELVQLVDKSDCAMFTVEPGTDITVSFANKKFYSMIQYTPEEFKKELRNRVMEVVILEERQQVRNLIARQNAMGGILHVEFRIQRKDQTIRWVVLTAEFATLEEKPLYYCCVSDITQQKRSTDEIYAAKQEVDLLANNILGGVIKLRTKDLSLLYANDGFYRLTGYSRAEYGSKFGSFCENVICLEDRPMVERMIRSALDNQGNLGIEYRIINKSEETRWVYMNGCRIDDTGDSPVFLCIIMDTTNRKKLEMELEDEVRSSGYLHGIHKRVGWVYDMDKDLVHRNGYLEGSYSMEREMENFLDEQRINEIAHPDDAKRLMSDICERMEKGGHNSGVYLIKDNLGSFRPTRVDVFSVNPNDPDAKPNRIYGETHILSNEEDKSLTAAQLDEDKVERIQEKRIVDLAENALAVQEDSVTDMMTYRDFIKKMSAVLKDVDDDTNYGVICSDINDFSKINYHYGVSFGNEILRKMGTILREKIAYQDICSRIRGDYFVALFSYKNHNTILKTLSALNKQFGIMEGEMSYATYGTTSGAYLIENIDEDVIEMIAKADLARRSIKGMKGNRFAIYTEDLQKEQFREEEIIRDIDDAIKNHTVEICYMPRIKDDREHVIGCKVIPQIQRRTGEYLPLEDLKRYMDRTQEVQQLVFYVLSNVCRTQGVWKAQGKKIMPISVDITQGQLCQKNAVERIDRIVSENGLDSHEVLFEIQERYFRDMTPTFQKALEELHKYGYRIIISRFGSDHTSVHSIRHLPIYAIKFHGEFFHENFTDEKEVKILSKIVEMAHDLDMKTSCGGIHTEMQEKMAKRIGCNIFEGDVYYGMVRSEVYARCFLEK